MTLTLAEVESIFLFLESWPIYDYGESDAMTSSAKKVIYLTPGSFGTLALGILPQCHEEAQIAMKRPT